MKYGAPDPDSDSSTTTDSFHSAPSMTLEAPDHTMSDTTPAQGSEAPRMEATARREERSETMGRREVGLPRWNGARQEFDFYLDRLEARLETEYATFFPERTTCLDMVEKLPESAKPRIAAWFGKRKVDGNFCWRALLEYFREVFADRQAQQAAIEKLHRLEQGSSQYFAEFLLDFEQQVGQCGVGALTEVGKSTTLREALNFMLKKALVGVRLPPRPL
ncbi:hypothetical protein K3495_g7575 [Podosphaera aphanis]|nr:hypothetical protein K3495_g7575 [Podosphaera aphanis]